MGGAKFILQTFSQILMYLNSPEMLMNSHENSQILIPEEVVTIAAKTMVTTKRHCSLSCSVPSDLDLLWETKCSNMQQEE